jgi:hypothetical protein
MRLRKPREGNYLHPIIRHNNPIPLIRQDKLGVTRFEKKVAPLKGHRFPLRKGFPGSGQNTEKKNIERS